MDLLAAEVELLLRDGLGVAISLVQDGLGSLSGDTPVVLLQRIWRDFNHNDRYMRKKSDQSMSMDTPYVQICMIITAQRPL